MAQDYSEQLKEQRQQKEQFFAEHPQSPIPRQIQDDFPGLEHFPVDEDLRFELDLEEHDEKESLVVETTTGNQQEYIRWGEFTFEIDGEEYTLQAYKSEPHEDRLWVPFRDETNADETYGAGRYLDLEGEHYLGDGQWVLDLNQAYNPTCAYNDAYECPLIPTENWLDVRIEAGEKKYPGDPHGLE